MKILCSASGLQKQQTGWDSTHWEHVSTEVLLKSFYVLCISSQEDYILPRLPIYSVHFLDGPI